MLLLLPPTKSVLKQREVPATVSSFHVSVLYTAMLRTSITAVVPGCFYCCPLDCDNPVMVVYRAAVETGCMLEKYIKYFSPCPLLLSSFASILLLLQLLRRDMHFCFLIEVLLLLIIVLVGCAAAAAAAAACAAYNISTEAERGTGCCFFLLRFCPLHCDASDVYCVCYSWLLLFCVL